MEFSLFILPMVVLATSRWAVGQVVTDLSQGWKFKRGDDAGWAGADFDDSDWRKIEVGEPWEQQGNIHYDGYGWYRMHVVVPATLRRHEDFRLSQSLLLALGQIDDTNRAHPPPRTRMAAPLHKSCGRAIIK